MKSVNTGHRIGRLTMSTAFVQQDSVVTLYLNRYQLEQIASFTIVPRNGWNLSSQPSSQLLLLPPSQRGWYCFQ